MDERKQIKLEGMTTVAQLLSDVKPISEQELKELRNETIKLGKVGAYFNYEPRGGMI